MTDENKLNFLMEKLRDKFLKDINQFCKENQGEGILVPLSTLVGTAFVILSMADSKDKFTEELADYSEKVLNHTIYLMEKIQNERTKQ